MSLVAINLDDEALELHQSYMKCCESIELPNWDEYLAALVETSSEEFSDPMLALKQLRQTGSVREFQFAFARLLAQCNLSVSQAISYFLGGLKEELLNPMKMHEPQTLSKIYRLAGLVEVTLAAHAQAQRSNSGGHSSFAIKRPAYHSLESRPHIISVAPATKLALPTPRSPVVPKNRRTISPVEMQAKRAQALCYFCDDKYSPGHKCTLPKQLFVLDLEYGDDECSEEAIPKAEGDAITKEWSVTEGDPPMISLCALSGIQGAQTIRVIEYSNKRTL